MKYLLFPALLLAAMPLFALRPGDKVGNPEFKLKWIDCTPFKIGELTKEEKAAVPPLRAAVFLFTRAESSGRIVQMLDETRLKYRKDLLIAVITPDTEHDTRLFRKKYPDIRVRVAVDAERKLTPLFMAGSMLYPMAFIYDADGQVLWNGEAVDFPEAVQNIVQKKNDVAKQRKTALLLDEMQQRMRSGELRALRGTADKIFKLDPANPSALRMILFALENTGNLSEAWELLNKQIKKSPHTLRLYFTALEMMRRNPAFQTELPRLIQSYCNNASRSYEIVALSEALLINFASSAPAIAAVQRQLGGKNASNVFSDLTPMEKVHFHTVCARLCYILCNIDGAINEQQKALKLLTDTAANDPRIKAVEAQLKFYQEIKRLISVRN